MQAARRPSVWKHGGPVPSREMMERQALVLPTHRAQDPAGLLGKPHSLWEGGFSFRWEAELLTRPAGSCSSKLCSLVASPEKTA